MTAIDQAREALALCHALYESLDDHEHDVKIIAAVILQAREECAKIVEAGYVGNRVEADCGDEIRKKAAAIRALP